MPGTGAAGTCSSRAHAGVASELFLAEDNVHNAEIQALKKIQMTRLFDVIIDGKILLSISAKSQHD